MWPPVVASRMRAALLAVLLLSTTLLAGLAAARPSIDVAPSFRADGAHALNVTTTSVFTLQDAAGGALRYRFLGGQSGASAERVYAGPFTLLDHPGFYTGPRIYQLQAWREGESDTTILTFYVDDAPPVVAYDGARPMATGFAARVTDDRVGVERVVLWRQVDAAPFVPVEMAETEPGLWAAEMPREPRGTRVSGYLQAWDRVGNTGLTGNATAPYFTYVATNGEPTLRLTAPNASARVGGRVLVAWEAEDPDGDALAFAVFVRGPADRAFREVARLDDAGARSYTLDASGFVQGEHVVRVSASDGGFVALDETTIVVPPPAEVVRDVRLSGDPYVGATLELRANVTRVGARVEARLIRDGLLVEALTMTDDGLGPDAQANDREYATRFRVRPEGLHTLDVFAQYAEDGTVKATTVETAASFEATQRPLPSPPSLEEYAPMPSSPAGDGPAPPPAIPWPAALVVVALAAAALARRRA